MPINAPQLHDQVIRPVLGDYDLYSTAAAELLLGTAAVESRMGTFLVQCGGPALGIYQMEPPTHDDIWANFLSGKTTLRNALQREFGHAPDARRLVHDLRYATLMARIHYLRVREALPHSGDVHSFGVYWKKYYNTPAGKGTPGKFVAAYTSLVRGVQA